MTRKAAIERAVAVLSVNPDEAVTVEVLNSILEQYEKTRKPMSDEQKATLNAARKAKTAAARADEGAIVMPVLKKYLNVPRTAKELYETAKDELPAGFSPAKVQTYLLRELEPVLDKTETKGMPNTYVLIDR